MLTNAEIAQELEDLAGAMQLNGLKGVDKFKVGRYKKAATAIRQYPSNVAELPKETLMTIDGVGNSISDKVLEFVKSGKVAKLETLKKTIPPITINEFTKLKGIGPVFAKKLWEDTGCKNMQELIVLSDAGKLNPELTAKINFYKVAAERVLLNDALEISNPIFEAVKSFCKRISYGGSVLRKKDTVHDVDILVYSEQVAKVKEIFKSFADTVESEGDYKVAIYKNNLKVEIAFIKDEKAWGGALFHFTGPKEYNKANRTVAIQKGWLLNDKGLWNGDKQIDDGTEESICQLLGVPWIIPELRELAIDVKVVKGHEVVSDLHIHSNHSDGRNSVEEIVKYYFDKGFKTIAITDHGKGLRITKIKDVDKYFEDIENVRKKFPDVMKILIGIEANIDKNGDLDYTDDELSKFDFVIASIHFNMEGDQTERLVKAINNKNVKTLGHVTCEEYGIRKPIQADWNKIFDECAKNNVKIEINGADSRIFLSNELIQIAKQKGVKFTFGSDMHGVPSNMLSTSLWRAQRAGLTITDFWQGD